jgi:polyvinyl alcohol dehydrogenase (cytochrome)
MKTLIVTATAAAAALTLAMPLASSAQQAPDGAALFDGRCKFCHDAGTGPSRDALSKMTPAHIVEALTTGPMQSMAAGMSDADKQAIATYLTASASGATPAAPATNAPATSATPATPAAPATNAPTTP